MRTKYYSGQNSCTKLNGKETGNISQGPHAPATEQKAWHLNIRKGTGHERTRCILLSAHRTQFTPCHLRQSERPQHQKRRGCHGYNVISVWKDPESLPPRWRTSPMPSASITKGKGQGTAWWFALGGLPLVVCLVPFRISFSPLVTLWFQRNSYQLDIGMELMAVLKNREGGKAREGGLPQSTITSPPRPYGLKISNKKGLLPCRSAGSMGPWFFYTSIKGWSNRSSDSIMGPSFDSHSHLHKISIFLKIAQDS